MIPALQVTGHPAAAPQTAEALVPLQEGGFDVVFRGEGSSCDRPVPEDPAAAAAEAPLVTSDVLPDLPPAFGEAEPVEFEEPHEGSEADPDDEQDPEDGTEVLLAVAGINPQVGRVRPDEPSADGSGESEVEGTSKGASLPKAEPPATPDALHPLTAESTHVRVKTVPHRPEGLIQRESVIFSAIQFDETQQSLPDGVFEDPAAEVPAATEATAGSDLSDHRGDSGSGSGSQTALRPDRVGAVAASGIADRTTEQAVLRQLADAITQSRAPHEPAEISLDATELGRLHMMVAQDRGAVSVTLTADRPETLDLLRRNIDLLARDLRDLGFDSLNFSFQQGPGGGADRQTAEGIGPFALPEPPMPERSHPVTPTITPAAHSSGGLDLRL